MAMKQLYLIQRDQTATFGGGDGLAVVSPFRAVTTSIKVNETLGLPFNSPDEPNVEATLRYYANCKRSIYQNDAQNAHADKVYSRLLAGEEVYMGSGIVVIREIES